MLFQYHLSDEEICVVGSRRRPWAHVGVAVIPGLAPGAPQCVEESGCGTAGGARVRRGETEGDQRAREGVQGAGGSG